MAQEVKTVTSESLESAYRALTPSQQGFTQDLMASNTIIPVLDLSSAAAGTSTGQTLQTAWDNSTGHTRQSALNTTTAIITNPGFWQVDLTAVWQPNGFNTRAISVQIDNGTVTKVPIWQVSGANTGVSGTITTAEAKFVVFLRSTDQLEIFTHSTTSVIDIWYRQIADVNGTLVNPSGFTPQ